MKKRKAGLVRQSLAVLCGLNPERMEGIWLEVGLSFLRKRWHENKSPEIGDLRITRDGKVFVQVGGVEVEVYNA